MDIIEKFRDRIEMVNGEIENLLKLKDPETLYKAARHLPLAGGKRLRPIISMISSESVGGDWKQSIPFCVSLELMHNFTLVHDDIMDRAPTRRNIETVHTIFGEATAIIAGDVLFAKSYESLHNLKVDSDTFRRLNLLLTTCIEDICEGQQMDMDFERVKTVKEEEYMEMIEKKTASLFSCASEGGAVIGGGDEEEIRSLSEYGRLFGLAFQIQDDILDLKGEEKKFGKRIGNDIREGKKTLIIIHALQNSDGGHKKKIISVLGKKDADDEEIRYVIDLLDEIGSIDYAKEKAHKISDMAKASLEILEESDAKNYLEIMAEYAARRSR